MPWIFKAPKKLTCKPLFIHTTNINHIRLNFYIWYSYISGNTICSTSITLWTDTCRTYCSFFEHCDLNIMTLTFLLIGVYIICMYMYTVYPATSSPL